jgi:Fur family ferric uptake transcriptional regulator
MSRYLALRRALLPPPVVDLAEQVAAAGYKVTGPRLAVLRAIAAWAKQTFSVHDLEQWLQTRGESPGVASIFRTVRLLCTLHLVERIHGLDDCHRYCLTGERHGHHLICTRCGALERFDNCGMQQVIRRLERQTGFQITAHLVELFGLCPRCVQAGAPSLPGRT